MYTLNYEQAKLIYSKLIIQEEKEIKKLNKFRVENNINEKISKIDSLSKIMLVNFLYQLNDYYKKHQKKNEFKDLLSEYQLNTDLKYRLPNFCGNKELIFYTYLQLFYEIFYFEDFEVIKMEIDEVGDDIHKKDNNEENINKINTSEESINDEEECFSLSDWSGKENKSFEFCDDEINNDIDNFFIFINDNKKKFSKGKMSKDLLINRNFYDTYSYIQYLNLFDIFIKDKMLRDHDKNDFLGQIDFIYFAITYIRYNNKKKNPLKFMENISNIAYMNQIM